ncbi:FadR/GntR family transcriptional regulator [Conexibacter sp. CPCC 206217]|uniref:FadR/GntR family transcriptional regulator n=1 Tax=Conexibacter sp. CPCC 206217 TaxID=3064574 RepID=UPI00272887F0|nr:FadR/GntR family transcriptional regulator [Conexibacter sp. CPCC 206217]MDO8213551.1 FadR/GntR family transcriptional regulator [Conexibacter sp. CPCC 206217]
MPRVTETLYNRITPVRTFESIVEQVRESISSGKLRPGDRLPNQRELATQFGVSRNGVLEAIRVLERAGLVEVRPGSTGGTFVRRMDGGRQFRDQLELLVEIGDISVLELAELRQSLEGANAYWAAKRATAEDLSALEELLRQAHESESLFYDDHAFHQRVAVASGNRAAAIVFAGVLGGLEVVLSRVPASSRAKGLADLEGIYEAIAARDPDLARTRMRQHISDFAWIVTNEQDPSRKEDT